MDDKININLMMAGVSYPLTIDRDQEEMAREAAKQVDIRVNAYRRYYKEVPKEVELGMAAFQFAMEALRQADRNDTSPYTEKIKELREVLENHFKEQG